MLKRLSTLLLSGIMLFSANCFGAQGTNVVINGRDFTNQVVLEDGVIFAPYDSFSEAIGYPAQIDTRGTGFIVIENDDGYFINIPTNGTTSVSYYTAVENDPYKFEEHNKELPAPVKNENSTYLVPIRTICEILGITLDWNNDTKTVIIQSAKAPASVSASSAAVSSTGEKMVTKSQLEAEGRGPDSVYWRYQEDYLADKPIPESALIYKPKANTANTANTTNNANTANNNTFNTDAAKEAVVDAAKSAAGFVASRYKTGLETIGDAVTGAAGWLKDKLTK